MNDIEKILKDAKTLSESLGEGNAGSNMLDNMTQVMNMMELIKSFRSVGHIPETPPAAPAYAHTPQVSNNVAALMAMAPFMGESNRKNIMVASKLMELMHFVNHFESTEIIQTEEPLDNKKMLLAARPYVDTDKKDMVDLLITVMDISDILKKIERMNADANRL